MEFKVGDKVTGFDGKKMFEGAVRSIQSYREEDIGIIKNNKEDKFFNHKYVYPTGTTIQVIFSPKIVEGWFNLVEKVEPDNEFLALYGGKTKMEALKIRDTLPYLTCIYLGPPIYITQTSAPTIEGTKSFTQSTDAMVWAEAFVEHKKRCRWALNDIDESLMVGWFANAMMAQEFVGKKFDTVTLNRKSWEKMKENIRAEHSNASNMELAYKWGLILNNIEEVEA